MNYKLIFPKEFKREIPDLIKEWNRDQDCRRSAIAGEGKLSEDKYDISSQIFNGCVMVLSQIGIGLATAIIYDKLKKIFNKRELKKSFKLEQESLDESTIIINVFFITEPNDEKESNTANNTDRGSL